MTFQRERAETFDLGRIVSRTFGTIQSNLAAFYALALVCSGVPTALLQMVRLGAGAHADPASAVAMMSNYSVLLGALVSVIAKAICSCFLISGALAAFEGRRQTIGDQVRAGLAVILPVFGIEILSWIAIGATSLLLVVPGFIVMCMLSVAVPAEVAERAGVIGALSRSAALTKGRRWSIFGALLLYFLVIAFTGGIITLVAGLFFFGGVNKTYLTAENGLLAYVGVIVMAIVTAAYTMIGAVGLAALYAELRLVKEGPQTQSLAEVFA